MEPSEIENRLGSLEARLLKIESLLQTAKTAAPNPATPVFKPIEKTGTPAFREMPAVENAKPGNWLGIIAVICFVLAAGFIIKLSIDSGWLTPIRQIVLADLLGAALIGTGLGLIKSDRSYAGYLPGAGIIVFYLSSFAAYRYYSLIPPEAALVITAFVSGLCIWLYTRIKHDIYPLTASVGAYLAPLAIGLHTDTVFSLYYFLVCSFAFAVLSVWVRSRSLVIISSYLALLATGAVGFTSDPYSSFMIFSPHAVHEQYGFVACMLALHFLVFSLGTYLYSFQTDKALSTEEAWSYLPVLLIFYAMEYYCIDALRPALAPWISLGFAAFLIGLYLSARKYFRESVGSQSLVIAFATIVAFHSVYLELLPDDFRPWLLAVVLLLYAFFPRQSVPQDKKMFLIPALALLAIAVLEYLTIMRSLFDVTGREWLPVSFAGLAGLWAVLALKRDESEASSGGVLLSAAHALAIMGLYRLAVDTGSLAVSALWLCYAVAVILFAFTRKDRAMAKSALMVLGLAAGKALLYDAASAPTLVRIFCLLLTGAVLYGCGFFMRKTADWKETGVKK